MFPGILIFIHFCTKWHYNYMKLAKKPFLLPQKLKIEKEYYWCLVALWTSNKLYVKMTFLLFHAKSQNVTSFQCLHVLTPKLFAWHMPIQFFLYKYRILQIKWLTWPIDFMQKKKRGIKLCFLVCLKITLIFYTDHA